MTPPKMTDSHLAALEVVAVDGGEYEYAEKIREVGQLVAALVSGKSKVVDAASMKQVREDLAEALADGNHSLMHNCLRNLDGWLGTSSEAEQ